MERLKGIGVSEGLAVGPALVAVQRTQVIRFAISDERVPDEIAALGRARARSREQLEQIRERVAAARGPELASIFDAQLLMLDDAMLVGRAEELIRKEHANAEWATQHALDDIAAVFNDVADPYLRERKGDLHDVAGRLRMNLRGEKGAARDLLQHLDRPCVLIADELTPSVVAQLDWTRIRGFATDAGSRTYHTAILARSLGVPAVVGLHDVTTRVAPGATIVLDGESGELIIHPSPAELKDVEERARLSRTRTRVARPSSGPSTTVDGRPIVLEANIERLDDVAAALQAGAEGVGLYRSEFLLGGGLPELADEEQQYRVYRQLVDAMAGKPVTIRTFDVDERKLGLPWQYLADEQPFPDAPRRAPGHGGLRGIRLSLYNPGVFKTQLRALLRAAAAGPLRIMFPFVSSIEEVRKARALLEDARHELAARGMHVPAVQVGLMIEVPSAALMASLLAREVDFFTIGTNDLIQYTLAVDRMDERVSDHYQPLHPAVLRLIRHVQRGAARSRIPVSVCGEMASDPLMLRVLVGCGLTSFSMTPSALEAARREVGRIAASAMSRLAARLLPLGTADDIERVLRHAFGRQSEDTAVGTSQEPS